MSLSWRMEAAKQALRDNWITVEQITEEEEGGLDHRQPEDSLRLAPG